MKSIKISLEQAQRVKDFVAITQECDFEILLKSGKYVVDAKSILGIPRHLQPRSEQAFDCRDLQRRLRRAS